MLSSNFSKWDRVNEPKKIQTLFKLENFSDIRNWLKLFKIRKYCESEEIKYQTLAPLKWNWISLILGAVACIKSYMSIRQKGYKASGLQGKKRTYQQGYEATGASSNRGINQQGYEVAGVLSKGVKSNSSTKQQGYEATGIWNNRDMKLWEYVASNRGKSNRGTKQ